jgi:hypothetical protein
MPREYDLPWEIRRRHKETEQCEIINRRDREDDDGNWTDDDEWIATCCIAEANRIAAAPQMYELLKELEWGELGAMEISELHPPEIVRLCPSCDRSEESGHHADCKLAAVLKAVEGEKGA